MRQPTQKLIIFFLMALGVGYAVSFLIMEFVLAAPLRLFGFGNLTLVAFLVAIILTVWLDKVLDLGAFKWPAPKPKTEPHRSPDHPSIGQEEPLPQIQIPKGAMFPHETPSEHWDVDFGDGKQLYQGADLPIWILAGWAAFIIWAVVYLISGLPTFHF